MNSIRDILKKSFLDGYSSTEITTMTVITAIAISCLLALYIFSVYRILTRKTFYNKNFNITLAGVCVITSAVVLTIQSSVVVSLGMVGALSIVRFRTAVKEPMDLMFLFWSISVGIICGAGLSEIAAILSLVMTAGIVILDRVPISAASMLLVINTVDPNLEDEILLQVKGFAKHYSIKSRNMTADTLDLVIELRTDKGGALLKEITRIDGVRNASLISHNGETTF